MHRLIVLKQLKKPYAHDVMDTKEWAQLWAFVRQFVKPGTKNAQTFTLTISKWKRQNKAADELHHFVSKKVR